MSDLIPDGWANESIGTYVDKMVGGAPLRPDDFSKAGVRVIPKKAVQFGGKTKFNVKTYCTSDFASNNLKNIVNNEYIITSLRDLVPTGPTIGVIGKLEEQGEFILAQGVYGLKTKNIIDDYLIQLSNSQWYRQEMRLIFVGSTQVHIRNQEFLDVVVPIPPLPEQQKIAAILTSVDKVIEKTQAQIDKLKDLKTGMMQELLTVGVGIDGTPHTEFKDSPVGRIPKGWEVKPCKKLCSVITKGTTPTTLGFKYTESGINFIKVESIISDGVIAPYKFSYICDDANKALSRSVIHDKDILITIAGATVGKLAMVNRTHLPANTNQALAIVRVGENKVSREFLFYWLQSEYIKNNIGCIQTVGAQPNLSLAQIGSFSVPLPPINEQLKIVSALQSIDIKLDSVKMKLTKQASLKKALMQDLLTGKVRVNVDVSSSLPASSLKAN